MMTHDGINTRCCSGHVAWMEGPTFLDGEWHVEIETEVIDDHGLR